MKSRRQFVSTLAVALTVPAGWVRARVLTCPKCNYEYDEGAVTCGHCGAPLPAAAPAGPAPETAPAAPVAATGRLDESAARQLESVARQAVTRNELAAGLLLGRQAAALAQAAGAVELATRLEDFDRSTGEALRAGQQTCPVCKGQRKRRMLFANFAGEVSEQIAPNMTCPACNGYGTLRRLLTADQMETRIGVGVRSSEGLLRSLRYTDLGGIWVPTAVSEKLAPRELAALRGSIGRRCPTCHGFGISGCDTCQGAGRTACTGEGCVMGQAPCPECAGKRRISVEENGRTIQKGCTACKQTGVITCQTCSGRGWEPCVPCSGRGEAPCSVCKGKGQPPVCAKCTGRGLTECRNCKGTGEIRGGTCPACQGGRQALCTTCNGSGRKKR